MAASNDNIETLQQLFESDDNPVCQQLQNPKQLTDPDIITEFQLFQNWYCIDWVYNNDIDNLGNLEADHSMKFDRMLWYVFATFHTHQPHSDDEELAAAAKIPPPSYSA